MTLSTWQILALGYHVLSRLAYVLYVGSALRAQERSARFTRRWGPERGFKRFRRVAAFIMKPEFPWSNRELLISAMLDIHLKGIVRSA